MTLGNDFVLPDGEETPTAPAGQAPPSVIVIENRDRGLTARLMPPVLILCAALAISSYQRKTPVWPLIPVPQPAPGGASSPLATSAPGVVQTPPGAGAARATDAGPSRPESPPPAVATADPNPGDPAGLTAASPEPAPERKPSPFEFDPSDGLSPLAATAPVPEATEPPTASPTGRESVVRRPERESIDGAPRPEPLAARNGDPGPPQPDARGPSKDDILRDIEREAGEKDAKRQDLEGLKKNARGLLLNESLSKADSARAPYLDELRELLTRMGNGAGEEIEKLSQRYPKDLMPQVKTAYVKQLRTAPGRRSRPELVARLRALGVPEPLILDQLCNEYHHLLNTRNGPRTEDEVRVRAARALLEIPVTPVLRKFAPPPAEPQSSRRPDRDGSPKTIARFGTRP